MVVSNSKPFYLEIISTKIVKDLLDVNLWFDSETKHITMYLFILDLFKKYVKNQYFQDKKASILIHYHPKHL